MSSLKGGIGIKPLLQNTNLRAGHPPKIQISVPDTNLFKKFQKKKKQFESQSILLRFRQSTQPENNHHFLLPHPLLHLPLLVPQLVPHPPLRWTFAPSVFPSQYFPILLSPLRRTPATKFVPHRSPGSLSQPTSPMLPRFSRHPSLNLGVHSISPASAVTPYKRLCKISDILHLNNENNQLERRARPPKDVPLDAQLWT